MLANSIWGGRKMKILGAHWLVIPARSEHQASKRPGLQKNKVRTNQKAKTVGS